jgi:hypothetical protein
MTSFWECGERQATASATARKYDSNGWLIGALHSHLSDDKTVAKMGHPFLRRLEENRQQQEQIQGFFAALRMTRILGG